MNKLTKFEVNIEAIIIGCSLMFISTLICWSLGALEQFDTLEQFAVLTSFICTYLCVVQSRYNYIWGVLTTFLYSFLFYEAGLIGSTFLNIYLIPTLIYGWFVWVLIRIRE